MSLNKDNQLHFICDRRIPLDCRKVKEKYKDQYFYLVKDSGGIYSFKIVPSSKMKPNYDISFGPTKLKEIENKIYFVMPEELKAYSGYSSIEYKKKNNEILLNLF